MFESAGIRCDVCGNFVLGLFDEDTATSFELGGIEGTLYAHTRGCLNKIKDACAANDITLLPEGPIRAAYEKAVSS